MTLTRETSAEHAKRDLADRLKIEPGKVDVAGIADREFPDMSLGAPADGEMAAQMISSGWSISLKVDGRTYEYRADKYQLRLHNFKGENYVVK